MVLAIGVGESAFRAASGCAWPVFFSKYTVVGIASKFAALGVLTCGGWVAGVGRVRLMLLAEACSLAS